MKWNERQRYMRLVNEINLACERLRYGLDAKLPKQKRVRTLAARRLMERSRDLWVHLGKIA